MFNHVIMSLCGESQHFNSLRGSVEIIEFDKNRSDICSAYIINCDNLQAVSSDQELLSFLLSEKKPIVFSNPNSRSFKNPFKSIASFNVETSIYYPMGGYNVHYIPVSSATYQSVDSNDVTFTATNPVERILHQLNQGQENIERDLPQDLPPDQNSFEYVDADLSGTITSSWGPQPVSAIITYELCMMASYNPELKYLRCITMGSGINPSPMKHDTPDERGFFTEISTAGVTINDHQSNLTIRENDPQNTNNVTNVSIASEVSVGVNISENPGYDASYSVTTTETVPVSDFAIINDTKEDNSRWEWQLGLTSNGLDGLLDGNQIHEIPYLSKNNLQMPTLTTFQAASTETSPFDATVGLGLKFTVTFRRAWMDGNTMTTDGVAIDFGELQGSVDFNEVDAF